MKLKHPLPTWLRIFVAAMDNFQDTLSIIVLIGSAITLIGLAIKSPFLTADGAFMAAIFVVWLFVERRRGSK